MSVLKKRFVRNLLLSLLLGVVYYCTFYFEPIYAYKSFLNGSLDLLWDSLPLLIMSAIANFFNGKSFKEKLFNFFIVTLVAFGITIVIVCIAYANTMQNF